MGLHPHPALGPQRHCCKNLALCEKVDMLWQIFPLRIESPLIKLQPALGSLMDFGDGREETFAKVEFEKT